MLGRTMLAVVALALAAGPVLAAADDVTGTWKVSLTPPNSDQKIETTMKLKLEGEKVTGTYAGRDGTETAIEEGKFKDGVLTFNVTRERKGNKLTVKYKAKLQKDTLTGKMSVELGGETRELDWEAKKQK